MVIREVSEEKWERLYEQIVKYGKGAPLSNQYDVDMNCNGVEYILKVQPTQDRKIAILQAMEVCPDKTLGFKDYFLIDEADVLSALLEILIYQGAARRATL
ncbi:MAG: hypothetical protein HFE86_02710 [Clostridiales bacterium]|nr:hypothetical protein [Clostridiales bacterium]